MLAHETREGLLRLGIVHDTTLPHSPYQYVAPQNMWRRTPGRGCLTIESRFNAT